MAYNWGRSNNRTPAERMRTNHGPFRIPFPRGKTVAEQPFGLVLSGDVMLDYERIQIRIAAVQNGLRVFPESGGRIEPPKSVAMGPPPSKVQEHIMKFAKRLDTIWYRNYRDTWFTITDRPVGCVPSMYKDAATIQRWMYAELEQEKRNVLIVRAHLKRIRDSDEMRLKQQQPDDFKLDEFLQPWAMEELENHGQLTIRKRKADDDTTSHETRDSKKARTDEIDHTTIVTPKATSANVLGDEKKGAENEIHDIGHKPGDTQKVCNSDQTSSSPMATPERTSQSAPGTAAGTGNSVQGGIYKSGSSQMSLNSSNNVTPVSNPAPTPQTQAPCQHSSMGVSRGADLFDFACSLSQEELMGFINAAAAENEQEQKQKQQAGH